MITTSRVTAQTPANPVDISDLLERCLGRIDIADRVLRKFQSVLLLDLQQLEGAIGSLDTREVARIAHRMKGASLSVSAYRLKDRLQSLEETANRGSIKEVTQSLIELKEECEIFEHLESITTLAGTAF